MAAKAEPFVTLGFAAISWIEHYLVHGPGDVQGQEIELDDEFAAFIAKAYQVTAKGRRSGGARKVRRAFLSRAKGRSKSGLAAMIAVFEALGPCRFDHWAEAGEISDWGYEYDEGEPVGAPLGYVEVLCVATEEGQAGNTYDAIYYMLEEETASAALLEDYGRLDVGLTRINLPNKRGFIEPVTSADSSADGAKSTFIVADETHLWKLPRLKRLHGTMTRNLLKRKLASGWMLETSTMYGEGEESVAEGTHAYAKAIAEGRRKDATLLFDHRQAAMSWDLSKRRDRISALKEAYGPAAAWMDLEALADSWDDPQVTEADFRRFWLNQPVPTEEETPSALAGWRGCLSEVIPPVPLVVGFEVAIDRTWASIATAGRVDGVVTVGRSDRRPGVDWAAAELKRIQKAHGLLVVIDEKGPAAALIAKIELAGVSVTKATLENYIDACASMVDRVSSKAMWILPHPDVEAAFEAARWRAVGDRQVFALRKSAGEGSLLKAATLAAWGVDNDPRGFNIW